MRKLASIKTISEIAPIEGKDRIVLATVDGWNVIVKKDEFHVGDSCVYIEIDSVMPPKPEFEFLQKKNYRIKTMRMAGVISQGICFPLSILPQRKEEYQLGEDVTEVLGITQYEGTMDREPGAQPAKKKPSSFLMRFSWFEALVRKYKRIDFPPFISRTDETRIQNMPHILENKEAWVATEKIDGQSGSFCLVRRKSRLPFVKDRFEYIVCSRNRRLPERDNSSYWAVSDRYDIPAKLKEMIGDREWMALQGECIAPNVQKNKYKVSEPDLYVFNVIFPSGRLGSEEASELCKQHGLQFVPIISRRYILPDTVEEVLEFAHGPSMIGDTTREGIVFRTKDGIKSFKAVDPLFLLKYDE